MASPYTDQARTRVMDRSRRAASAEASAIGNTQFIPQQKGLFDGISAAQIIAAAAAAVTSMVLSSYIGIAGSVIGAAVSSVVTVVSSQLYRNFLDAGARKLKDGSVLPAAHGLARGAARGGAYGAAEAQPAHLAASAFDAGGNGRGVARAPQPVRGARVAPTKLQARAAAHRSKTQRRVVVFSVAVALVAVAIYVAVLLWSTAGEGLGTKPAPLFPSATQSQTQVPAAEDTEVTDQTDSTTGTAEATGDDRDDNAGASTTPSEGDPSTSGGTGATTGDGVSPDSSGADTGNSTDAGSTAEDTAGASTGNAGDTSASTSGAAPTRSSNS